MPKNEYTKEELVAMLRECAADDKVSITDLERIVFDTKFPDGLFSNAVSVITETRNDNARLLELNPIFQEKIRQIVSIQEEIIELTKDKFENIDRIAVLKEAQASIEAEVAPIEDELIEIKTRIDNRTKR